MSRVRCPQEMSSAPRVRSAGVRAARGAQGAEAGCREPSQPVVHPSPRRPSRWGERALPTPPVLPLDLDLEPTLPGGSALKGPQAGAHPSFCEGTWRTPKSLLIRASGDARAPVGRIFSSFPAWLTQRTGPFLGAPGRPSGFRSSPGGPAGFHPPSGGVCSQRGAPGTVGTGREYEGLPEGWMGGGLRMSGPGDTSSFPATQRLPP